MSKAAELAALIGSGQAQGNKNFVKNGSMTIAQRGTSYASITSAGYYTVDRQYVEINNAGTWTMTQSDDVPAGEGFAKSFKYDCTTADTSLGTSHYFIHRYSIEGQDLQQLMYGTSFAKAVTISFYVKSNKTGTYVCELQQLATDGSYPRSGKAFTINSANTWEKKTVTINGNTAKFIPDSNARGMDIMIWMAAGTDFTSGTFNAGNSWTTTNNERVGALTVNIADSTANEILFTGLQMEIGDVATPFEHRSFDDEWHSCQRYCTVYNVGGGNTHPQNLVSSNHTVPGGGGHNDVANRAEWFMSYPVKRSQPTITVTDPTNMRWLADNNAVQDATGTVSFPVGTGHQNADCFQAVTTLPITEVIVGWIYKGSGTYPVITIDSEL